MKRCNDARNPGRWPHPLPLSIGDGEGRRPSPSPSPGPEGTPRGRGGEANVRASAYLAALALLALLVASFALAQPAFADDPLGQQELQVERQLGCPICTNLPLNVCDNQLCQEMRGVIRQKLSAGETPDQVVAFFVSKYGDAVLLVPPQRGFNLAAWYMPLLAIVIGILIFAGFVRESLRRRKIVERRFQIEDPSLEQYRQQVRRDLEKMEGTG